MGLVACAFDRADWALSDRTSKYFLMSRFTFAFYLIAIFFAGIALLTGLLALCTRLASYLSGAMTFVALGFQGLATALMTCVPSDGSSSSICDSQC